MRPELLRKTLCSPGWRPRVLGLSGVTDAYQPVERRLELTRRCLAVLLEFRQPVSIITKNRLVTRDVDLLAELAQVTVRRACSSRSRRWTTIWSAVSSRERRGRRAG